jgi:hypothetical protein
VSQELNYSGKFPRVCGKRFDDGIPPSSCILWEGTGNWLFLLLCGKAFHAMQQVSAFLWVTCDGILQGQPNCLIWQATGVS